MKRIGDFDALVGLLRAIEIREAAGNAYWPVDHIDAARPMHDDAVAWRLIDNNGNTLRLTREGCNALGLLSNPATVNLAIEHCVVRGVDSDLPIVLEVIRHHVLWGPLLVEKRAAQ